MSTLLSFSMSFMKSLLSDLTSKLLDALVLLQVEEAVLVDMLGRGEDGVLLFGFDEHVFLSL